MVFRILTISDLQGNLDSLSEIYQFNTVDIIIITGNFGFWDKSTIDTYELTYLKQIVAFSSVLEQEVIEELNNISSINGNITTEEISRFRARLSESKNGISQFSQYVDGTKNLPCPVYTIFGPLDDPRIIGQLQNNTLSIPNLYLIDHTHNYEIKTIPNIPNLKLYGLGGTVKIHSLFDNGTFTNTSITGKLGELWITLLQIAELYLNVSTTNIETPLNQQTINIFITHSPVMKTPLLEHLAIITNADFTLSQGLHFRYPVICNGMSIVDSMGGSSGYIEIYRWKFSRLRMILGELWTVIKNDIEALVENSESVKNLLEVGLSLFDKISVPASDEKIVPLSLYKQDSEINKRAIKKINDYYFQAYHNLWHFNLCDFTNNDENNYMIFKLDQSGNFKVDKCHSQGFNFKFKLNEEAISITDDLEEELINKPYSKPTRGSPRGRGWKRGVRSRGLSRGPSRRSTRSRSTRSR